MPRENKRENLTKSSITPPPTPSSQEEGAKRRERLCIVTRQSLPEAKLIRFALGPDNILIPDVAAKLPGRGAWVGASRELVEQARKKGGFARALKSPVNAPETLADQTEQLLTKRCLDFIGMAKRAGALAIGQTQVEAAIREKPSPLLIEAADGAGEGREKLMSLHIGLWGGPPPAIGCFSASDLAMALGRDRVIHASLLQERLAVALAAEISRLAGFRAIVPASWPTPWRSFGLGLGGADAGSLEGSSAATSTQALED